MVSFAPLGLARIRLSWAVDACVAANGVSADETQIGTRTCAYSEFNDIIESRSQPWTRTSSPSRTSRLQHGAFWTPSMPLELPELGSPARRLRHSLAQRTERGADRDAFMKKAAQKILGGPAMGQS